MPLRTRLDALRRAAGTEPGPAEANTTALARRLGQLRAPGQGTPTRRACRDNAATALAGSLGATVLGPGVLVMEKRWPLVHQHGIWPVALSGVIPETLMPQRLPKTGLVGYFDTETSGLSGGAGTVILNCGLAWREGAALVLRQWLLTAFSGEAAMLRDLLPRLAAVGVLVTYNGTTFDLPLLRDRLRFHGITTMAEPAHVDLLHPVRRLFARVWPRCRLVDVEQRLLGFHRNDDMPGSEVPAAWRNWLSGRPAHGFQRVPEHNALDVLSLAVLPSALARVLEDPLAYSARPIAAARMLRQAGKHQYCHRILNGINAQQWLDLPDPIA